jgi:hypothetical protein
MTTKTDSTTPTTPATAPVPTDPVELIKQLRAIRDQIPGFQQISPADLRVMRVQAAVPPEFLHASGNAIGASETLKGAVRGNLDQFRQAVDFEARYSALISEFDALSRGTQAAVVTQTQDAGITAQQAYNITRQLVRKKEHADLIPYLAEMKRTRRPTRKAVSAKKQPAPAPATASAEPSAETAPSSTPDPKHS